jgi:hypothetical protein
MLLSVLTKRNIFKWEMTGKRSINNFLRWQGCKKRKEREKSTLVVQDSPAYPSYPRKEVTFGEHQVSMLYFYFFITYP